MDKARVVLGLCGIVLGGSLLWVVIPHQHLPPMMSSVSPAFYPNIGAAIILAGGVGLMITGMLGKAAPINLQGVIRYLRFVILMAVIFGTTLVLFGLVHFLAGGAFLVVVTMWLLGERRLAYLISVPLVSAVTIWLFFDVLLGRGLP